MADELRITVGSVVRLFGAGLDSYTRVVHVENAERLVVDLTGVHVRCHASRTYSERTRDESGVRYELRVDVARAELAGMAQRMDALVAGVERLQAAAGLDRPVVEGAPCATCGGVLFREIVAPRTVSWSPAPHRHMRCLGCQQSFWFAVATPPKED